MNKSQTKHQTYQNMNILMQELHKNGLILSPPEKIRLICINNFIANFLQIIKSYLSRQNSTHIESFVAFFIRYFINKQRRGKYCHSLTAYIQSWKVHLETNLEVRLFLTFLDPRQTKSNLRLFLKIRKQITKVNSLTLLDQINLTHQQTLAIIYSIYDHQKRSFLVKRLNQLYINLNAKLINTLKLQASVFIQFLLTFKNKLDSLDQQVKLTQENRKVQIENFNSKIDRNNGFSLLKNKQRDHKRKILFPNQNQVNKKKIFESIKTENIQKFQQKSKNQQRNTYQQKKISKFFQENSEIKILETSPGRLFKNAALELNILNKIDQILDSRKVVAINNNISTSKNSVNSIYSLLSQKNNNQDWSLMVKNNNEFKNKFLQKAKQELQQVDDIINNNIVNTVEQQFDLLKKQHDLNDTDFSFFQDDKTNIPEIKESSINYARQF